mgnify:CR=1 FL=1
MLLIGFLISLYIAYGAEQRGALTTAGAAWAVVVGTLIFGLGGGVPGLGLIAFFLTSTALSRYRKADKSELTAGIVAKGDCRDATQVLANGGPGLLVALVYLRCREPAVVGSTADRAIDEQVRAYGGPKYQVTQQVMNRFADAISEVAPDAAQDARFWLLSAMQRDLITREPDGRFELSDTGRTALKQPA